MIGNGNKLGRIRIGEGAFVSLLCIINPVALVTKYALFFVTGLLSMYAIALLYLLRGRIRVRGLSSGLPVYLLFSLMWLSVFWALYPEETKRLGALMLAFLWIFVLSLQASTSGSLIWLRSTVVLVPHACALGYIWLLINYGSVRASSTQMASEVGQIGNAAPALVELCVPYLFYLLLNAKGITRLVVLSSMVSSLFVILFSESRAAYVMLIATVLLIVGFSGRYVTPKVRTSLVMIIILVVIGIPIISVFGYDDTVGAVVSRHEVASTEAETGETDREIMYSEGLEVIREHWFEGIGFYNLGSYIEEERGVRVTSHNIVISAWGELGIVGLTLLLWAVGAAVYRLWRARTMLLRGAPEDFDFYSATLVALIIGLFHAQFQPQLDNPLLWVVWAVALSAPFLPVKSTLANSALTKPI